MGLLISDFFEMNSFEVRSADHWVFRSITRPTNDEMIESLAEIILTRP